MTESDEAKFVFNLVWTGGVFHSLKYFVCSQMAQSGARFRFLANGCTDESLAEMELFAEAHPDRVVEIMNVLPDKMGAHGVVLDLVFESRDDGEYFCLIDTDIKALDRFLPDFEKVLRDSDAVSSGRGVWCETDVVPDGHPGLAGEHFFRTDGFVYGSPHFAIYRRAALAETFDRWGVRFRNAGPDVPGPAKDRLAAGGHDYLIFDTGKVVNILFQEEHELRHYESPALMHVGGVSHYLEPGGYVKRNGRDEPDWIRYANTASRFEVARFTAETLHALIEQETLPIMPTDLDPSLATRLARVQRELIDLVETHRSC